MGWVAMSARDVQRIGILSEVSADQRTIASAARVRRSACGRPIGCCSALMSAALRHWATGPRGRTSDTRTHAGIRDYALALIREKYADFAPALAAEMLATSLLGRRGSQEIFP
jgi:hypothetical protein